MSTAQTSQLRAVVFGVGHLGQHHARIYKELDGVELVGIVDASPEARKKVGRKLRTQAFAPGDELPAFDLASVAVPTVLHHEIAAPLLDRGVHVLVEKPIATTLREAQDLVDRARTSGAVLSVGHVERFNPALAAVRERELEPRFIEVHRISPFSFRSADIGVVLDLMIHDLDVVLALVGQPVVDVRACGAAFIADHEDVANARLQFEGGCVANLTASRASLKVERKCRVFSPDCYVSMDFGGRVATIITKNRELTPESLGVDPRKASDLRKLAGKLAFGDFLDVQRIKMPEKEPLKAELQAFVDTIRGEAPPVVTGEDGAEALALAMRIVEAVRSWREQWGDAPMLEGDD